MTRQAVATTHTFCNRFLREFRGDCPAPENAVHRRRAARVLLGVPWQLIPVFTVNRRPLIIVRTLRLHAACLDDEAVGATPGGVSAEQLLLAWTAAGHRQWLVMKTKRQMLRNAALAALDVADLEYQLSLAVESMRGDECA